MYKNYKITSMGGRRIKQFDRKVPFPQDVDRVEGSMGEWHSVNGCQSGCSDG